MFTVTGLHDGVAYGVDLAVGPGEGADWGGAAGDMRALALLASHEGQPVAVTPVGPFFVVRRDDPASLLGALYALTEVVTVSGDDVPDVLPSNRDGIVY